MKYGVLCSFLFFVILLLIFENYEVWTQPIGLRAQTTAARKPEKKPEAPPMAEGKKEPSPAEPYLLVAEKNIFNPERKEFPVIMADHEAKKPIVRPQIVLYGVTITESYQAASIVNAGSPLAKGERELRTFKVGDRIGEYKLAKILPDRITMEASEDSFEVLLYDSKAPKKRTHVKTESKPAAITSTSPSAPRTPAEAAATPPKEEVKKPEAIPAKPTEPARQRVSPAPAQRPAPTTPSFPPPVGRRGAGQIYPQVAPPVQQ